MTNEVSESDVRPGATAGGADQLDALLHRVGIHTVTDTGWIRVTGEDRVRWLNGMVTNSIVELKPGDGNYSFVLNAQGRIQGDLWTYSEEASLLLKTELKRVPQMMAMFERYIIMDDVVLEDVSGKRFGIAVVGPRSPELLENDWIQRPRVGARRMTDWHGYAIDVIAGHAPLVPRYELWVELEDEAGRMNMNRMRDIMTENSERLGGRTVDADAMEWLRMLEGTPRYGVDIRDRELPQETGQTRALHFAKGCYLGQEIVERIRSRGNVRRGFGGFVLGGPLPAAGVVLEADGTAVGELTSVAAIPLGDSMVRMALGYVRREAVERGASLTYTTADGSGQALPVELPYRLTDGAG